MPISPTPPRLPCLPVPWCRAMNPEAAVGVPQQRHKEVYTHRAPWPIYALHWSQRPGAFRLGLGSCIEEYGNKLQVVNLPAKGEPLVPVATADHPYPPTKLMWTPSKGAGPDLMATTGDFLRIWDFRERDELVDPQTDARRNTEPCALTLKSTLANVRRHGQVGPETGYGTSSLRADTRFRLFSNIRRNFAHL